MSDVYIAVGLWWETRLYASTVLACFQVFLHKLFHKAEALFLLTLSHNLFFHILIFSIYKFTIYDSSHFSSLVRQ